MELRFLDGLNPGDVSAWEEMVRGAPTPDVYYRPGYVRAYHFAGEGRPVAAVIRSGSSELLFPLLIRDLTFDGESCSDAITPYGYGGMLLVSGPSPDSRILREAAEELRNWAHSLGLVACTIRLHPLLDGDTIRQASEIWHKGVRVFSPSQTIAVELERWDETSFALQDISKGRGYDLKRARAACRVRVAEGPQASEDLIAFQAMYRETMARLHADKFFFFPDEYYQHLADELGDSFAVATAFAGDRLVGSAVFMAGRDFAHYHLSGTNDEGRRNGAATLLMMAGCDWAKRKGCSLLHLGGGLQPHDSLWQFKRSFHGKALSYSYVTVIGDSERYETACSRPDSVWPYTGRQFGAATLLSSGNSNSNAGSSSDECRPLKIGYFGDGPWAHRALDLICGSEQFKIGFIVARYDFPDSVLCRYAKQLQVPFLTDRDVNSEEFIRSIAAHECDLYVSMSFNQILKTPILSAVPKGFINCHAGALPFYRGRNILNWAIINGERKFGVTVHYIDHGIDTGDIILQQFGEITEQDDYGSVLAKAVEICADTLFKVLKLIHSGEAPRTTQASIHPVGLYCCPRREGDEWIDWEWRSKRVYNFVRALSPPGPAARTVVKGSSVAVLQCKLIQGAPSYIGVPGEVVGRDSRGNIVKTKDSTLLITKIADVENDGLENIRVPSFPISTRMGLDMRGRIGALEDRIAELSRTIHELTERIKQ